MVHGTRRSLHRLEKLPCITTIQFEQVAAITNSCFHLLTTICRSKVRRCWILLLNRTDCHIQLSHPPNSPLISPQPHRKRSSFVLVVISHCFCSITVLSSIVAQVDGDYIQGIAVQCGMVAVSPTTFDEMKAYKRLVLSDTNTRLDHIIKLDTRYSARL
jgi:hypothetical protein